MTHQISVYVGTIFDLFASCQNEACKPGNDLMFNIVNEKEAVANPTIFNSFAGSTVIINSII